MTTQNNFAPGPPGFFPIGKYSKIFKNDPMELFMRINNDFGSIASFSIFGIRFGCSVGWTDGLFVGYRSGCLDG